MVENHSTVHYLICLDMVAKKGISLILLTAKSMPEEEELLWIMAMRSLTDGIPKACKGTAKNACFGQ